MNDSLLRICMIGNWPAIDVLGVDAVKPRYHLRKKAHDTSWMTALARALARLDEVERVDVVVPSREVTRTTVVQMGKLYLRFLCKPEPGHWDPYMLHALNVARARRHIRRIMPDIVHGFGTETPYGWMAVQSGFPSVVTIQGIATALRGMQGMSRLKARMVEKMEHRTVCSATSLIVSSDWARYWTVQVAPAASICELANIVSPEFCDVASDHGEVKCVCVGALTLYKNPQLVIRAFSHVKTRSAKLVMIGDGPLRSCCEKLVRDLGIGEKVDFRGRQPREGVIQELLAARCFALGSRVDTSPNVIIEALAMGVPVVATNAAGVPEQFRDQLEGYVVDVDDAVAMGRAMDRLLRDPKLAACMGGRGRDRVRREHAADPIAKQHVEWYEQTLRKYQNLHLER